MLTRTAEAVSCNGKPTIDLDSLSEQGPKAHAANQTLSSTKSQAKSVMDAIKLQFVDWHSMDKTEHEGKRLERLIKEKGYKTSDLARAAGLSWPAAKKWIAAEQIGPEARATVVKALDTLGIDPRVMWPPEQRETLDELKMLVQSMDADVLKRVRQVLQASRGNQQRLIDYIDGRIESVSHIQPK